MAEFLSYNGQVEVRGEVVAAFIDGFPSGTREIGLEILKRHNIHNPRTGQFYPLQALLNAMKEISQEIGPHLLTRIGERIAFNAQLPPGLDSLEQCLASIDVAYHMNHRGGEIGHYNYAYKGFEGGLHRATMTCPNCYPCAFDLGVIEGFSQRFVPSDAAGLVVRHDDTQPCRQKGGNSCTYLVSWG